MEGDVGMVAVVEGLPDAGLAVTLLSRRAVTGHSGANLSSQARRAAVDTATETTPKNGHSNSIYRSSYQITHCRPVKCTPAYLQYSVQGFQQYRDSPSRSAYEEAFVESLRKYPTSPIKSQSAELIERLLHYTHFRNGSRYSNTRSAKSLPSKEALKKINLDEIPTRDTTTTKNELKQNFGYKRDVELTPVPTSSKKSRREDINGMFDYLKSHHKSKKLKGTEVRYLTNLKQCIRERLQQFCEEDIASTTICPHIQSRYSQHRKRYHKADSSQKLNNCKRVDKSTCTCKQKQAQDTSKNESQISPSTSKDRSKSMLDKYLSTFKNSKSCFCESPEYSDCEHKTSPSNSKSKDPPEYIAADINKYKQCMSLCEHECNKNYDVYARKLKENVIDWSQELPVYANFSAADAIRREEIINQLIGNLRKIGKDVKNLHKVEYEIKECLKVLPMWRPENKVDQGSFENQLAQNLLNRIKTLLYEKDGLVDHISVWIESIPFTNDTVDKQKIIKEFIAKLRLIIINRPLSVKKYRKSLKSQITSILNELPIECNGSRNMVINNIADKLVDKLVSLPRGQLDLGQGNLFKEHLHNIIQKWFDDMPNTLSLDTLESTEDREMLVTKLQELQSIENNEYRQNRMRQEIMNWLRSLLKKLTKYIDIGTQENLVNKLVAMINDELRVENNDVESDLMAQKIWEWFEAQPEFNDNTLQLRDLVTDLSEKLRNIIEKKGDVTKYDVKAELTKWFEQLSRELGIKIDSDIGNKLQEKLLPFFSSNRKRKCWEKPYSIHEVVTREISDILNDSTVAIKENDKERLGDQILQIFTQDWNAIKSMRTDKLLSKITNIIKQTTDLPEGQIASLAKTLTNKIKEDILPNLYARITEPLELNNDSKNQLKHKLENILNTLLLKDKARVIEAITDALMANYKDDKNGGIFEVILGVLKKTNVSENESQCLTSNILDMWHQFKNELNDTTLNSSSYGSTESLRLHKKMFRLEREITNFMEKSLNESSSFYKETDSEDSANLYDKFKIPTFTTSTPLKPDSGRKNIENKYKNQIKEIIKKWIGALETNGIKDENFKNDMANDIATDIIDRQRYLQLYKTKCSSQEELEHLKYQVFKWTSKLPNQNNLTTKTSKLKLLLKSIEAVGLPNLIQKTNEQQFASNLQDTPGYIVKNICDEIKNWLHKNSHRKYQDSDERQIMDELITELSKKLKNLLSSDAQLSNIKELCKNEILLFLRKLDHEQKSIEEIKSKASELINYLKNLKFFADILEHNQEARIKLRKKDEIKKAVKKWCQTLPFKRGKMYSDTKDIVDNLAEVVSRYLLNTDMENVNTFMDEILTYLRKLPLQFNKDDNKNLPEFAERLIETLKEVLSESERYIQIETDDSSIRKPALNKAADKMFEIIQNWCENLPLDLGFTNENCEEIDIIKQNLVAILLEKVCELNLNPEIFHDDTLYEDILKDEIEKILDILPENKQLQELLRTLKGNLVKELLGAKEELKNEIAGSIYKQKLRDVISETLSSMGLSITETEQTPLELLKDNLADAFISLCYVANDDEIKKIFKEKIFYELNKFCDNYLKQNPSSRLNIHHLNQELYKALKKVPMPREESMRREVEQIRIKDLVKDWFKKIPFDAKPTSTEKHKIISILAKRLYEIVNDAALNPDIDVNEAMDDVISKWLKKFNLKSMNATGVNAITKSLINKLKDTKHSRKMDESSLRKSMNYDSSSDLDGTACYPPSRINAEDRAHLQRIKGRTSVDGIRSKGDGHRNASIIPVPIATGIQSVEKQTPDTHIYPKNAQNASIQTLKKYPEPATLITPQVVIKEYYWDSQESPTMQESSSILLNVQPPTIYIAGSTAQQAKGTPPESSHLTPASQRVPTSKATTTQEASIKQVSKKAGNTMFEIIQNWCENLPLDLGFKNADREQIKAIKQNLLAELLEKVGELNLNPEIFHDDDLYEDILKDEIDKILDIVTEGKILQKLLPTLKDTLVKDLLKAKEDMKTEIAGFTYKKKLKDAIFETLSSKGLLITETEQALFQHLKDNLADAFICSHYVTNDEELKKNLNENFFHEVKKFCDNYLEQNPLSPLNAHQLNQELYNALMKIPMPKEESMRREVEQIRIKDLANDWFKKLPLEATIPHSQKNKIISILAKKLYEIKKEAALNPDIHIDEKANNEISKWLKKFKLNEPGNDAITKPLINKLITIKHSSRPDESSMKKSINNVDLLSDLDETPSHPPIRLSEEERAHLQRIKGRPSEKAPRSKKEGHRDVSVMPVPIATGIQTKEKQPPDNHIYQKIPQNASIQTLNKNPEPATQITPQVIVKEYYWDSHESPTKSGSGPISTYIQPQEELLARGIQQQAKEIPYEFSHVTSASQTVPLPTSKATTTQEASIKQASKKAGNTMFEIIQNWCENLPLDLGSTNEACEQISVIKQNLAAKLRKKIGELNLNPELFHDDDLYEDILKYEIEKILDILPKNKQLEESLLTLKENLVKSLFEAKEELKNKIAGTIYKKKLKDAISKTLSSIGVSITETEQTSLELLKDNLADAFISLHYVAKDEELKNKYKDKFFKEVSKFCDDYLKRNPSSPINVHQLNQELYNSLKKVPMPNEETIRREAEQIRIKDLVNDWFQKLPLEATPSLTQINKMTSVLAKKLYEIEKEAALNPDIDKDEKMNNEVSKWLNFFKLRPVNKTGTDAITKPLINKLKDTKHSRNRKSINYVDLSSGLGQTPGYPPIRLSAEDRAHLQRIKDRNSLERSRLKDDGYRDASVVPNQKAKEINIQTNEYQTPDNYILKEKHQNASIQTINLYPEPAPPASKVIINLEPPNQQVIKTGRQNDGTGGTSTKGSCCATTKATAQQQLSNKKMNSKASNYNPDHYSHLNSGKIGAKKPCLPCWERDALTGKLDTSEEVGTSKAFKQNRSKTLQCDKSANVERSLEKNRFDSSPCAHVNERNNYWDDEDSMNQHCYRRLISRSPKNYSEDLRKRKRKSQQQSNRKSPTLTKCTIRPHPSCHYSNKSCYVVKEHCPKCWDGFCPHPSFLYFRPN